MVSETRETVVCRNDEGKVAGAMATSSQAKMKKISDCRIKVMAMVLAAITKAELASLRSGKRSRRRRAAMERVC